MRETGRKLRIDVGIIEKGFVYTYNFTNAVLTYQGGTQVKWNSSYDMNVKFNVKQTGNTATLDISVTGVVTGYHSDQQYLCKKGYT